MLLVDPEGYKCLTNASNLRAEAESIYELYTDPSPIFQPGSFWKDIVMDPSRPAVQSELKTIILIIEKGFLKSNEDEAPSLALTLANHKHGHEDQAMASVFARRLDALKHIMPSYGTDDSSHGNLTCARLSRDNRYQITGLLRACPSASSRTRHQAEYGDSQVRESSPCKILLNPRNEDDAKRSDGKDSQLQAADAPTPPLIFNKMQLDNNNGHAILTRVLAASFLGFISAAAATLYYRRKSEAKIDHHIIPGLVRTESGRLGNLERFSDYVARQMGFADADECPRLCKLAYDYLKRSEGCENNIYDFFANLPEFESLYVKLMEEFEKCILTYFAFHWSRASLFISQVIDVESVKKPKLKGIVMAATRKQRFERVTKNLKVTRAFSTLVEELKAIGQGGSHCTEVMVPVALSERSPVLLLMGGGMGAGKSTVTKDILKEPFWSGAKAKAVVVEADAFKESDVIYRAISSMGHHDDMLQTAELVHQSSTNAASSLLVTALNEGRDVIMDGTLSWEPFVEQTIAMARNVHTCRYRMGPGYQVAEDGTVDENYWEKVEQEEEDQRLNNEKGEVTGRKPYRIELVGVVCDPYLAVVRGIRRAITTRRAVRVNSQLKSHKRFASAFERYCQLVDNARLFCTNSVGAPPSLIAWKDGDNKLLVDPEGYKCLTNVSNLRAEAESIYELYTDPSPIFEPGSVWKDIVLDPSRPTVQSELRASILNIEKS
ncbi:hypothetical protein NC652_021718 [Populus alba x Populus x berolinensis]|nr:hypothetical protein NC652_021718 [Populus alba x Populus x berolinensis]